MKKVLVVVAVVVVGFVAFVAARPAHFKVTRELQMKAPAEAVYANLVDFHEWGRWSPWDKMDPSMTRTYGGADRGVGATYMWTGNDKVGTGAMKITDAQLSEPSSRVVIAIDFVKPMEAHNTSTFAIATQIPGQVLVGWTMEGDNNFVGKAFGVFMNIDKMVGDDFARGLEQLRIASEGDAKRVAEARIEQEKKAAAAAAEASATTPHRDDLENPFATVEAGKKQPRSSSTMNNPY